MDIELDEEIQDDGSEWKETLSGLSGNDNHCSPDGSPGAFWIRFAYIVAAIIWIIVILALGLHETDIVGFLILAIPILVFFISYINVSSVTVAEEQELFRANYLSIGLIIVLPLLVWMNKEYQGDKRRFMRILILAIVFTMLAMIDVWVTKPWISLLLHVQSIFETFALVLLIYALYDFYIRSPEGFKKKRSMENDSIPSMQPSNTVFLPI